MIWGLKRKQKGATRAIQLEEKKEHPSQAKIARLEEAKRSYARKIKIIKAKK